MKTNRFASIKSVPCFVLALLVIWCGVVTLSSSSPWSRSSAATAMTPAQSVQDSYYYSPATNALWVQNNNLSGSGSLTQTIEDATHGAIIKFAYNVTGTVPLNGTLATFDKNLTIIGPGAQRITITSASPYGGLITINAANTVTISGVTLENSQVMLPIACVRNFGILTLTDCTVTNSSGGGIYNQGALTLNNCTVSNNYGYTGGGIQNDGTLNMVNCTISQNQAMTGGGGIYNQGLLRLTNCTIAGNQATCPQGWTPPEGQNPPWGGGGIYNAGTVECQNTLIAGNQSLNNSLSADVYGVFTSLGHNLIGKSTGSNGFRHHLYGDLVGDFQTGIDPRLAPLDNYGGTTKTHALLAYSPALNAGDDSVLTSPTLATDQRGFPRKFSLVIDIGAVEAP